MPARVFDERELDLLKQVLDSGNLSSMGGKFTGEFEEAFAEAVGARHAVSMNSAMSVLHSAVKAAGAGAGDEVICDPVCVFGTVAVMYNNAIPVFVDVDPVTWNMRPELIEAHITERTKAIIVTHVWGLPAEMDRIVEIAQKHNLLVIEDCAHSLFATYKGKQTGTWGDIGSFSFQMSKQMALGDGGMAVTDDEELAKALALNAGAPTFKAVAHDLHWNYRMTEQTAAIGIVQLERGDTLMSLSRSASSTMPPRRGPRLSCCSAARRRPCTRSTCGELHSGARRGSSRTISGGCWRRRTATSASVTRTCQRTGTRSSRSGSATGRVARWIVRSTGGTRIGSARRRSP